MKVSVLYVEDNPSDIELFKAAIESSDSEISLQVSDDLQELHGILKEGIDVIISDFNLAGFDGLDVLQLAKKYTPQTPFIFFSSTIGEEKAVDLIRKGATDFVLKDNISKIPLAIDRAMNESILQEKQKASEKELLQKTVLLDTLFNSLTDLLFLKGKDGIITKVNNAFCDFFQTTYQNAIGKSEQNFLNNQESKNADQYVLERNHNYNFEIEVVNYDGELRILEVIKTPLVRKNEVEGIVTVLRDVTQRRVLERKNDKDQYMMKQAENHTKSGSFELDEESDILTISPNFTKLLNLRSDKNFISSTRLLNCIHPEDRPLFKEKFYHAVENKVDLEMEHRYIPVGSTEHRYCKTVLKPYPDGTDVIYCGTILDTTDSRESSRALLNIQEEERERISKELHDNVGPKLSASSMFLDADVKDLSKVKRLVDDSISDIRSLSRLLTTSVLENNTFSEALDFLLDNTPLARKINLITEFDDESIPEFVGGQLYRILQEALNNTMKYAEASAVELKIEEKNQILHLTLTDDGKGFDMETAKLGNGLRNIRERVRNCNGELHIESKANQGTKISIKTPIKNEKSLIS